MVYQQIAGIPMGTKLCSTHSGFVLFCYERDFMSDLHKSKRCGLIDMFNDTSRYLDDIFSIDNPAFGNIFLIYTETKKFSDSKPCWYFINNKSSNTKMD